MVVARLREKSGLQQLLEQARSYLPEERLALIEEAYSFAESQHGEQRRKSGEPYIVHPLDAALTVAKLQLDANAIAAALLPDGPEDWAVPKERLKSRGGGGAGQ